MKYTFNSPGRRSYKDQLRDVQMSNKKEHPQRYGWWISELSSLGIKKDEKK